MNVVAELFTLGAVLALVSSTSGQNDVQCKSAQEACYRSAQCCEGLVCASYAGNYAAIPEFPGQCIKEKDEHFCTEETDCPSGQLCSKVGTLAGRPINMCVQRTTEAKRWYRYNGAVNQNRVANVVEASAKKRRGAYCKHSDQCAEGLCCQEINRFRQRTKYLCEPIHHPSSCIRARGEYHTNEVYDFGK